MSHCLCQQRFLEYNAHKTAVHQKKKKTLNECKTALCNKLQNTLTLETANSLIQISSS